MEVSFSDSCPRCGSEQHTGACTRWLSYAEYAKLVGATYGTVKRWATEGMPVNRASSLNPKIDPVAAKAWLAANPKRPTSFHRKSVIYFAQREDGCIKIGFTSDVGRRMRELSMPELLATMPGDKKTEQALHARFAEGNVGGEWFSPSAGLREFLDQLVMRSAVRSTREQDHDKTIAASVPSAKYP